MPVHGRPSVTRATVTSRGAEAEAVPSSARGARSPGGREGGAPGTLGGVLAALPLAIAITGAEPGFPVKAANERYQLWTQSVRADRATGDAVSAEIARLLAAAVATGRPQRLTGVRVAPAAGGSAAAPLSTAVWDVAAHPLHDRSGRVTQVMQLVTDATDRAQTRERLAETRQLAQRRRLEVEELRTRLDQMVALDKLKTDFMNLTTHELRSPLAIVYGYLGMMEAGVLGALGPELTEAVSASIQSVEVMNQLVTELLEMARLDEGHISETRERVDLVEVVTAAAARAEASDRHRLRLDLESGPAPVLGGRSQLLRVFANLVDNAVKYSPEGGEIAVSLRRAAGQVSVDVTDHGLGVPAGQVDRLFTRFGRIVTPANQGIEGTGLGLYLCRETARRLGGDVTATSIEGRGSTFTVRLPLAPPREAPA